MLRSLFSLLLVGLVFARSSKPTPPQQPPQQQQTDATPVTLNLNVEAVGLETPYLLHAKGDIINKRILASDELWFLWALASDAVCGETCGKIRGLLHAVAEKSGAATDANYPFKMAYVNAEDVITGPDGDSADARSVFNYTEIRLFLFPSGPKGWSNMMRLDPALAGHFLQKGPKYLHTMLQIFQTSLASPVRAPGFRSFMSSSPVDLPRVLLFTSKKEMSSTVKGLSTAFGARAIVGQVHIDDPLASTFGVTNATGPALFVSLDKKGRVIPLPPLPASPSPTPVPTKGAKEDKKQPTPTPQPDPLLTPGAGDAWTRYPTSTPPDMSYASLARWLDKVLPEVNIPRITGKKSMETLCGGRTDVSLCFIASLPSSSSLPRPTPVGLNSSIHDVIGLDSGEGMFPGQLAMAAYKRSINQAIFKADWSSMTALSPATVIKGERVPAAFMWLDGETQEAFVDSLHLPTPGLVAYNPRKKMAALYKGSFAAAGLREFIISALDAGMGAQGIMVNAATPADLAEMVAKRRKDLVTLEPVKALGELVEEPEPKQEEAASEPPKKKVKKVVKKVKKAAAASTDAGEKKEEL